MPADPERPVLVFDGDCSFCRIWVGYWQALTGDKSNTPRTRPPRAAFRTFPSLSSKRPSSSSMATSITARPRLSFTCLRFRRRLRMGAAVYELVPGVAVDHRSCSTVSSRRIVTSATGSRARSGVTQVKPSQYTIASSLFARAIALIYLVAFVSFGRQVRGLIGAAGNPARHRISSAEVHASSDPTASGRCPRFSGGFAANSACLSIVWGGAVIAGVAAIGRPHTSGQKAAFVLLFIYYLSIVNARADLHVLSVGFPAARSRLPRHLSEAVLHARLAVPLAACSG